MNSLSLTRRHDLQLLARLTGVAMTVFGLLHWTCTVYFLMDRKMKLIAGTTSAATALFSEHASQIKQTLNVSSYYDGMM